MRVNSREGKFTQGKSKISSLVVPDINILKSSLKDPKSSLIGPKIVPNRSKIVPNCSKIVLNRPKSSLIFLNRP